MGMNSEKAKTLDGERTSVEELSSNSEDTSEQRSPSMLSRITRAYKNLNLFMAGMYTGVGCSGTPHTHHSYKQTEKTDTNSEI